MRLHALGRLVRCRRGSAAVEAAFALPVLLLLLLGTVEMGRVAWIQSSLSFAVQEAARCASVRPDLCGTNSLAGAYAAGKISVADVPASAFTLSEEACGKKVRASFEHRLIMAPIFPANPVLSAEYCRA